MTVTKTRKVKMLTKILAFVAKIVAKIQINYTRKIEVKEYETLSLCDLRGCIILTYTPWALGNLFIWGKYKHVEIIVDGLNTVGAVPEFVRRKHIIGIFRRSKRYVILLPKFATLDQRIRASEVAEKLEGIPYDYEFNGGNKALYCSEVVLSCYRGIIKDMPDYGTYTRPIEFLKDKDNWEVVKGYRS